MREERAHVLRSRQRAHIFDVRIVEVAAIIPHRIQAFIQGTGLPSALNYASVRERHPALIDRSSCFVSRETSSLTELAIVTYQATAGPSLTTTNFLNGVWMVQRVSVPFVRVYIWPARSSTFSPLLMNSIVAEPSMTKPDSSPSGTS